MDANTGDRQLSEVLGAEVVPDTDSARTNVIEKTINWFEKYLLVLVIGGLIAGIGVASVSQPVVDQVDSLINTFMELYGFVAPVAIFLILTPSLARLFSTHNMGLFGAFVIAWFAGRKILAGLWAIAFVAIVFRVPLLPEGSSSAECGSISAFSDQTFRSKGLAGVIVAPATEGFVLPAETSQRHRGVFSV